jgi:hypothetical protein
VSDSTFDGAAIVADARAIAFPRYPGTDGCRRAQAIVADWFRASGLDVAEEPFRYDIRPAFRAIRLIALSSALLLGGAGLIAVGSPGIALGLLLAGFAVGGTLLVWSPGAERLYRGEGPTATANVAGWRRCAQPRLTLIVLAHYDSKSQNLSFPWRNGPILVALLAASAMLVLVAMRFAMGGAPGPVWLPPVLGGVAAGCLLLLSTLSSGNESPGGVDNAGSVAIVHALADKLPVLVPSDVELVFLSPSAEEDHMIGAMRWLDRHLDELRGRPVYALNFDGAGAPGRIVILDSYGLFHRFAPELTELTLNAARRLGVNPRRIWLPPAVGIDAIPFHHRGVPCLTYSSGSLGAATMSVHSSRDVADHLDAGTLAGCARLACEVAVALTAAGGRG